MFSATDLIEALRKRARRSLRPERPPGEFPEGWARWFQAMAERAGRITGASADAIIAIFLQREPAMPPRSAVELDRWRAFATLWRQQWQAPELEERRVRLLALALTFGIHLLLLLILLWLAYVHVSIAPPTAGEEVVQVEFVGQGTPQDQGGGAPAPPVPQRPAARPASVPAPTTAAPTAAAPATVAAIPAKTPAAAKSATPPAAPAPAAATPAPPQPPAPTVQQPLQVTERSAPDATFVLPPPTPRQVEIRPPQIARPTLQAPLQAIELIQAPPPVRPMQATIPDLASAAPQLKTQPKQIEIIEPLPQVQPRPLAVRPLPAPRILQPVTPIPLHAPPAPATPSEAADAPAPSVAEAPATNAPAQAPASLQATAPASAAATTAPTIPAPGSNTSTAATPVPRAGDRPVAASGNGPASIARPGAWPTPKRGDDWGDSTRNRPGGAPGAGPGLFNSDGSPRVGSAPVATDSGFPPGSDHWTREQLDRAGTWLKRPPNDYTPTRFDQYWVPSGTLLEEWVRKGIREIAIPIPGTSKKINCVISILQFGGGCGISDPNLKDEEATARPPPDVPFKQDLQDDQDSLRKPAAP